MKKKFKRTRSSPITGILTAMAIVLMAIPCATFAAKDNPGKPGGETAGNNLSFPVIWAENVSKVLPGTAGMEPITNGEWWYWWGTTGTDPNIVPLSCPPDPDNLAFCDDGIPGQATGDPPGEGWVKAYLQKDPLNGWQAGSTDGTINPIIPHRIVVDWIDWGDNLESVDWYTKSQVRTEVVLYEDLADGDLEDITSTMTEYEMRHVSGWGINEVHGLAVQPSGEVIEGSGTQATVFSNCARLTIQKLLVSRDDPENPGQPNPLLDSLTWDIAENEWSGTGLVNPPIFNLPVYEGGDGPGYYSAEINVKGKVIYGYTWNVRKLNDFTENGGEADGDYRITFSFDALCPTVALNTFFEQASTDDPDGTQMIVPLEEEEIDILAEDEGGDTGGATGIIDYSNNLTYIDVRILERTGGGGGGGNGGGKGDDTAKGIGAGGGQGGGTSGSGDMGGRGR